MFPRFKGKAPKYDRSPIHKNAPEIVGIDMGKIGGFHATPANQLGKKMKVW